MTKGGTPARQQVARLGISHSTTIAAAPAVAGGRGGSRRGGIVSWSYCVIPAIKNRRVERSVWLLLVGVRRGNECRFCVSL